MERIVRIATAGSVDDGKSTLIGRLLVATGSLYDDQLSEIDAASARRGRAGRDLAFATDGLREERERSITLDAAYRPLRSAHRRFLLADAPGHEEYTHNMVTAASTADLMVVLVDASQGIKTQTRRHLAIAAFLRVPVVLAVNKMDLVGFDRAVFERITTELRALGDNLGCPKILAVPISAFRGDNVVEGSEAMPWYEGPSLLGLLESFPLSSEGSLPPCLPVQNVFEHEGDTVVTGTLLGSPIRTGERLAGSAIRRLWVAGEEGNAAQPGQPVAIALEPTEARRGDRLSTQDEARLRRFEATVFWMHPDPLRIDMAYRVRQGPRLLAATVRRMVDATDLQTGGRQAAASVATNDLARVEIELDDEVSLRLYAQDRDLGSFLLIDPKGHAVAAGTVDRALPSRPAPTGGARVFWLTGLSGAGKSSIAEAALARLREAGVEAVHLDGDTLRTGLCADLGFSPEDRRENVRRTAEVAKLMASQGRPTICSLISPLRAHRAEARRILGQSFCEVFVRCELEECVRRDPKGLYARALAGSLPSFTGIGAPYEPPEEPDLILDTQSLDLDRCVDLLVRTACEGRAV